MLKRYNTLTHSEPQTLLQFDTGNFQRPNENGIFACIACIVV